MPVRRSSPVRPSRSWPRRIVGWLLRAIVIFVLGSLLWVLLYRFVPPPITFTMMGDLAGGRSITKDWMPLSTIDPDMPRAAIAAEDGNFCTHNGFDYKALQKAFLHNAEGGRLRGGSTISQQTAKNAFLWQGRSWLRKGLEGWFTVLIELLWDKKRIMEVYLNVAETGIGTYGVNAGSLRYFKHDASRLSPLEAARIAAVLPLPAKREAIAPSGATRRYGNKIQRRISGVRRYGFDRCLR
jgi:monofunctional glycosyltransferase